MSGASFKVPHVVRVNEAHPEPFGAARGFNDVPQEGAGRFRGRRLRKNYVRNVVFADAGRFVVGIKRQGVVAGEDGFGAGEAHAQFVKTSGAVQLRLPVADGRKAQVLFGHGPREVVQSLMRLAAVGPTACLHESVMNEKVLSF